MIHEQNSIGDIRKIIFKAGHQGPKEIGCNEEFVQWLTDPVLNGGGASVDFGCYGANLMTWLMKGQKPTSVTAVTQHIKPKVYPKVDDEATILLTYPQAQGIIQASWNWPFNRKDMEVYGPNGYIHTVNGNDLKLRINNEREKQINTKKLKPPFDNSLSYFTAVVKKQIQPMGLSSLNNNMIVTEIIDAARRSAATGKTVHLKPQK
jgi:predicted dehydrogenase